MKKLFAAVMAEALERTVDAALVIAPSLSEATANLERHSETENLFSFSMSSRETPITVAPCFLKSSAASAKAWASRVQPGVKAAG